MKYTFSKGALKDLREIGNFIALDNPILAVSYVSELRQAAINLTIFPLGYPLYFPRNKYIRRKTHGNYAIFYFIQNETIIILRFLHLKRKIKLKDLIS